MPLPRLIPCLDVTAGRVVKGVPAPDNLKVPPYRFVSDTVIIIGEDQETA